MCGGGDGAQVGLSVSPMSNDFLFLRLKDSPLRDFLQCGLNATVSTDGPTIFHLSGDPLLEEYTVARTSFGLSMTDLCEMARNSVKEGGEGEWGRRGEEEEKEEEEKRPSTTPTFARAHAQANTPRRDVTPMVPLPQRDTRLLRDRPDTCDETRGLMRRPPFIPFCFFQKYLLLFSCARNLVVAFAFSDSYFHPFFVMDFVPICTNPR